MSRTILNNNVEKITHEQEIFFEIPIITALPPSPQSTKSDSDASCVYVNISKRSLDRSVHSDEEADTSFINNNNAVNGRVSVLQTLSPGNLNASAASRGNVRRWSQSLTNASKGKQNRTINILPSRFQHLSTALSLDGQLNRIVDSESEFDQFVQEIEQYDYLMEDSYTAAQTRNKILRALPQSLYIKRQIKSRIGDIVKEKSQRMGTNRWKRGLQFFGLCKTKTQLLIQHSMRNLKLWNDSMKEIEGHFGAGAETFFRLFRYLFIINLLVTIITFTFVVFPQLAYDYFQPRASNVTRTPGIDDANILNLLSAEGSFENSTLFYGAYTDRRIPLHGDHTYSLPFAYLMTMVCVYAITFIVFSITTAESYRKSFIATSGGQSIFGHKVFCSWDFSISNQHAAEMKHQNIFLELQSIVNQLYDNECSLSIGQMICGYTISTVIWIFVMVVLIAIGSTIAFAPELLDEYDKNGKILAYFEESSLIMPTCAIVGLLICQNLFEFIGYLEIKIVKQYRSPRAQLHIALIRNYLLNIVLITSLVWFWLAQTNDKICWETWLAQNIYRLIIAEFFVIVCCGSMIRFSRFLVYKYIWRKIGISEFNISRGCIGLVLNQTLLWIGIFFSPPLAGVIVLKMIVTFYLKKLVLISCCKPPSKLWRSSQTYTLFLSMLFVSLTIVIVISLYVLTQMNVSKECGPFRTHMYMFHVLREDILKLQENHFLWQLIMFLVRPAAIGLLLLTLCVLVYYIRSKSKARIEMVKLLKQMLYIEAKDKEFLLANITRVTQNNEWLLDESVQQKPLFGPSKRNFDKYSDKKIPFSFNGKFSHFGRRANTLNFTSSGRLLNGRKMETDSLRKRRPSSIE